jgi:hypothetical protein
MVVICGENKYKLDTSHVIDGVVVEGTREGMFSGNDLHWRFYYVVGLRQSICTGGLQLPACKNDDFY